MDVSVASNMKYSVYQSMLSFSVINNPEWYARSYHERIINVYLHVSLKNTYTKSIFFFDNDECSYVLIYMHNH